MLFLKLFIELNNLRKYYMDAAIAYPIVIGSALLFSGVFFWYTYHNQGGMRERGSEEEISAELAAKIKHELKVENDLNHTNDCP